MIKQDIIGTGREAIVDREPIGVEEPPVSG